MGLLTGSIAGSASGNMAAPALSSNLGGYGVDYWPVHAAEVSALVAGTPVRTVPRTGGALINALVAGSYLADYYYRVHIVPVSVNVGNLASSKMQAVEVWNAFPHTAQTLTSLDAVNTSGINLTEPAGGVYPMTFAPLLSRTWQLDITTQGTPTIDASYTWHFTGLAALTFSVTGDRVAAWTVPPDWASGITETLHWLTDAQQALDGSVARLPLREVPRREWEFGTMATGGSGPTRHYRELMESAIADWRGRVWALPIWTDQTVLAAGVAADATSVALDTTGLDFAAGAYAMLHAGPNDFEVLQIAAVAPGGLTFVRGPITAYGPGVRLWPCRLARLTGAPVYARGSANHVRTTVRFQSDDDNAWTATAPATTYAGFPVLEERPDESGGLSSHVDRQLVQLDGDVGGIYTDDPTGLPWAVQGFVWRSQGRTDRAALRSLLYWLGGRAEALWLPSFADDLTLAADVGAGDQVLSVWSGGFTRYSVGLPGRRHIRIELNDGTLIYRAITNWAEVDADTEHLTLDTALASAIPRTRVRQISFMALVHGASDDVQIDHQNTVEGIARCAVDFAALPADEPAP